jgi:hypothetical protein
VLNRAWAYYKDRSLDRTKVGEVLVNQGIVPATLQPEWAKYFVKALEEASLLIDDNGREFVAKDFVGLQSGTIQDSEERTEEVRTRQEAPTPVQESPKPTIDSFIKSFKGNVVRRTISNDREFVMIIPEDLTDSDVFKIRKILQSTQDGLEGYLAEVIN